MPLFACMLIGVSVALLVGCARYELGLPCPVAPNPPILWTSLSPALHRLNVRLDILRSSAAPQAPGTRRRRFCSPAYMTAIDALRPSVRRAITSMCTPGCRFGPTMPRLRTTRREPHQADHDPQRDDQAGEQRERRRSRHQAAPIDSAATISAMRISKSSITTTSPRAISVPLTSTSTGEHRPRDRAR